jgi:KaiC/GvpD/RAD55 family RecA-like ATPase
MSLDLLSVLGDREHYYRFRHFIRDEILSHEVKQIINDLENYYETHASIDSVDWEQFSEWFVLVKHPTYKRDKVGNYEKVFDRLSLHTTTDLASAIVEKYIKQDYCARIADIALRGSEGEEVDLADVEVLLDDWSSETERASKLDTFIVTDDLESLVETVVENGYKWRMQFLNESIGSVRKGKLMCFAARPNTGKTTFLASEATFIAPQLPDDEVVLWFNNEEAGEDVKFRVVQAALGWDADKIRKDVRSAMYTYETVVNGKGKIVIVDKADLSTKDIEEFVRQYNPGLIVVDQLWKVHGYEKSSATDTARLGHIFQWAREIAKKHAPILTVHQVKTEGEGVDYLTPSMLYLSGTVIQGEVDSLVMMGRKYEAGYDDVRFLTIAKNKGAYGPDVNPKMREGRAEVMIVPETAQYKEVV